MRVKMKEQNVFGPLVSIPHKCCICQGCSKVFPNSREISRIPARGVANSFRGYLGSGGTRGVPSCARGASSSALAVPPSPLSRLEHQTFRRMCRRSQSSSRLPQQTWREQLRMILRQAYYTGPDKRILAANFGLHSST